jgi:tyrosinase
VAVLSWVQYDIDRIWAQWQDDGHQGSAFYPATGEKYGHNLNDKMWPWDGGDSMPGLIGSTDIRPYLPLFASSDIVRPIDTLGLGKYSYTYDTFVKQVPETTSTSGLLAFGALGIGSLVRRKKLIY